MSKILISLAMLLTISACSTNFQEGGSSFNIPILTKNEWQVKGYPFNDSGTAYCVVDGGRNNIRVILEADKGKTEIKPFIESTRFMGAGVRFKLNSYNNSFSTSNKYLSEKQSKAIIDDLKNGQTIYLRWSEVQGGQGRQNFTNLVTAASFAVPYKSCIDFINEQIGIK